MTEHKDFYNDRVPKLLRWQSTKTSTMTGCKDFHNDRAQGLLRWQSTKTSTMTEHKDFYNDRAQRLLRWQGAKTSMMTGCKDFYDDRTQIYIFIDYWSFKNMLTLALSISKQNLIKFKNKCCVAIDCPRFNLCTVLINKYISSYY